MRYTVSFSPFPIVEAGTYIAAAKRRPDTFTKRCPTFAPYRAVGLVGPGRVVTTGELIGYEGNTGFSTGCHVHFAVHINGSFENPRFYLP